MPQTIAPEFQVTARWRRDPGISELIEYLDQPKFLVSTPSGSYGDFDALSAGDWALIEKETLRCQADFVYAAKNFFWITNKDTGDQLFALWESQELILEEILKVRAMGLAQKFIILKARQLGALRPGTKVLTADLRWVEIDSLKPGDQVVSVDEHPAGGQGVGRKFRTADVLDKWEVTKEAFKITLENGKTITATGDHPFLCKRRGGTEAIWRKVKDRDFAKHHKSCLSPGDQIRFICDTWDADSVDFEDGWFSGLLDGEGSLRQKDNGGIELSVSQVDGPVLRRAAKYLSSRDYQYSVEVDTRKSGTSSKLGNQPVYKLVLHRAPHIFRLLGLTRPTRFIERHPWVGKDLPSSGEGYSWIKVVSVESIGDQRMVDIRTSTSTFIAEGMVTHNCSTLIEAMIAWSTMFNTNINAVVVGPEIKRTQYLFSIMLHIYDQMPWWLKPLVANREFKEGLFFNNPDVNQRRTRPGLNSRIELQTASQYSGIGEGIRLTALHVSELGGWGQDVAREAIDGDLGNALAEKSPMTFAIIESTAKGAGTYYHDLWRTNVEAGEDADWRTIFLPFFFEKTRVEAPPMGWRPDKTDTLMREQIANQWVRCSNMECGRWREALEQGVPQSGTTCPNCKEGTLHSYILSDEQLRFIQKKRKNAERKGADSVKELKQELSSTADEAFQLSGDPVFPLDCLDFAEKSIREPILQGFLDKEGRIHGMTKLIRDPVGQVIGSQCFQAWCSVDHRFDDKPLKMWELMMKGHEYSMGVDIAEGLGGKHDSSVIVINRIGQGLNADVQVATWRSNEINHYDLALPVVQLGKYYNYAVACIEYNTYQTCADHVRIMYSYPNIYRWKNLDSSSVMTTKWHWITQGDSKPKLWGTAVRRLRQQTWIPRSANLVSEMKTFQKDEDSDKKAEAERGFHDDELMAAMIASYCAHELDQAFDNRAATAAPVDSDEEPLRKDFELTCLNKACGFKFDHHEPPRPSNPPNVRCEKCATIMLSARRKGINPKVQARITPEQLEERDVARNTIPAYDDL